MIETRTFKSDEVSKILERAFKTHAYGLIEKLTIGDVVSIRFHINEGYSVDHDWVAKTRFRNTINVSVYNGIAYEQDALSICRMCSMYLVTEEMFEIIAVYYWINPVYRTQFLGITGTEADYESMIYSADKLTQKLIRKNVKLTPLQEIILDIIRYYTTKLTNRTIPGVNAYKEFDRAYSEYKSYMMEYHEQAFRTARRYPAQQYMVDDDGYIILEQTASDDELKRSIKER